MIRKNPFRFFPVFLLTAALALGGCAQLIEPVTVQGGAQPPVISVETAGVDNPNVFVNLDSFKPALLKAMAERDAAKLRMWMTEPFLTGGWTADMTDTPPADAISELLSNYLPAGSSQVLVKDADLKALLGTDPLSIPRAEAGVVDAFLVGGWGKDGRDEAVLFISRQTDNSLKWHGWMVIKGGFSGTRLGGSRLYENDALGFAVYLPKTYEAPAGTDTNHLTFIKQAASDQPMPPHPDDNHVGVFVTAYQGSEQTAEQAAARVAEEAKAMMGAGYTGAEITALGMGGETAYSVNQLPGQDFNRRLFVAHNDVLYDLMFIPDNPNGAAYQEMEDVYAMIVNTWKFK